MNKIAKKIIEEQENKEADEKLYFKAYFHYAEGNYKKALKLFNKLDNSESLYMKTMIHLKTGNFHEAIVHLQDYEEQISKWPNLEEKEHAIEQISRLKEIIRDKFI